MRFLAAALVAAFFMAGSPALAHQICALREAYVEHLATKWGEAPVSHGVLSNGRLLEVLLPI